MGLFGLGSRRRTIATLVKDNCAKERRIRDLENLCREKDSYFMELMSDGMRHGSSLAAKHMAERREYLKGR